MECCICYDSSGIYKTKCNHQICLDCVLKLKNLNCPYCRIKLNLPKKIEKLILDNNSKISKNHKIILQQIRNQSESQYENIILNINNGQYYEINYLKELLEDITREKVNIYRASSLNWWEL